MRIGTFHRMIAIAVACWLALPLHEARACTVPVFRYALERWAPDAYEVLVYHAAPLSEGDRAVLEWLKQRSSDDKFPANVEVRAVDISAKPDAERPAELPAIVVRYPPKGGKAEAIWSGRLTREAARAVVSSPARRQAALSLLEGESAVWVLLESGDREKDDAAAKVLSTQLQEVAKLLSPPRITDDDMTAYGIDRTQSKIPLKVSFSMVRVSRDDPGEAIFVQMLVRSEPDLHEYAAQPMAFPVFGRGRALYALVGRGINEANIAEACAFITDPCSCQVKVANPGFDLLMAADWDGAITGEVLADEALPPLTGVMPVGITEKTEQPVVSGAETMASDGGLLRIVAIVAGLGIVVVAAGTIILLRGRKSRGNIG
ncbi:MAG: hypothetical protein HQ592_18335 [Planctomycetes bacterium]|nr:hypothetical protein [Planctomycetota bacterium]